MKKMARRLLAGALALVLAAAALPFAALADESTTFDGVSVAKDLSANTEMYVLNDTAGGSYPHFGAKYEPDGAVYYGRTTVGGDFPPDLAALYGGYGQVNILENDPESAVGYYFSAFKSADTSDLKHWEFAFIHTTDKDTHLLMVYMNMDNSLLDDIAAGKYDVSLRQSFGYFQEYTEDFPVFVRVGGEMNVLPTDRAPVYISAYRRVAQIAREESPDVALVFSPNFTSSSDVDMDIFYPGDEYVDWVGVSLYFNEYWLTTNSVDLTVREQRFGGAGVLFGDPMLNVQMAANLSTLHRKPLMVTEGGAAKTNSMIPDRDMSSFAARRIEKAMGLLPMVYPQIKGIILSDYVHGVEDYRFYNNPTVTEPYRKAVEEAGVYIGDFHDLNAHRYLTPLSDLPDIAASTEGDVALYAYTYSPVPENVTATFSVDGAAVGTSGGFPYKVTVSRESIVTGSHTVGVSFSNGEKLSYTLENGKVTGKVESASTPEPSSWAVRDVNTAIALGIVPGELRGSYTRPITRGEYAKLAVRFFETTKHTEITGRTTFPDTDDVDVQKLAYLKVVNGKDDGNYHPDDPITRQEAATIMVRFVEALGYEVAQPPYLGTYSDIKDDSVWGKWEITKAASLSLMNGIGNNLFDPMGPYTVEQSILTFVRIFNISNLNL